MGTDRFETLTGILYLKSVYLTVLLGAENADGPKDTVELNEECRR